MTGLAATAFAVAAILFGWWSNAEDPRLEFFPGVRSTAAPEGAANERRFPAESPSVRIAPDLPGSFSRLVRCGADAWDQDELQELWGMLCSEHANATLAWIERLPEGFERDAALHEALRWLVRLHPARSREWVERLSANDLTGKRACELYAAFHARIDLDDALAWASRRPEPAMREAATRAVLATWAEQSPSAVAAWISRQVEVPLGDLPLRIARMMENTRPEMAFLWAMAAAKDDDARFMQMRDSLVLLAQEDREGAEALIANSPRLSPLESITLKKIVRKAVETAQ